MASSTEPALALRDIHLPAPPPWWPPAHGWWLLALAALLLLALATWWLVRRWRVRRRRRQVALLLLQLEQQLTQAPAPERLAGLSELLKRLALQRHSPVEVAALSGDAWLNFLDRSGGDGAFTSGPGRVLADGGYRADLTDGIDVPGLMRAVRLWVRRNTGGYTTGVYR